MESSEGSSLNTSNVKLAGALLAHKFISNTRKKAGKEGLGSSKKPNARELVLETNRKMEQNNNIITGQKSKNWDLIKQKITTAKISDALSVLKYEVNGKKVNVLRPLGEGGYSQVYEVYDKSKSIFALKAVNLYHLGDKSKNDLIREIVFLEKLKNCDGVVKAFDYELKETPDSHWMYVLMEKGDMDLHQILTKSKKEDTLTPSKLRFYWEQMLQAVRDVHAMNIIHADIKPGNFLLVAGQLKLIDFGFAMETIPGQQDYVQKKTLFGTRDFMSPEVFAGYIFENGEIDKEAMANSEGVKYSKKVDIWALGIILYHTVYEVLPFTSVPGGKNGKIKAIASIDDPVDFPSIDNIDPMLLDTLKKCLQKDPSNRPEAEELLQHQYLRPTSFSKAEEVSKVCPNCLSKTKALKRITSMRLRNQNHSLSHLL